MSFHGIVYRLIGLFMVVVSLWRMSGGGDELVESVKSRFSALVQRKEAVLMRPYYPDGSEGEVVQKVVGASTPPARRGGEVQPDVDSAIRDYYPDWRSRQ
jgi:hypothetical protein